MIVHDCAQGSPEWIQLRLGIPTASRADDLLTPKTRKPSESRHRYRYELLTEWLLDVPLGHGDTGWMERGHTLEAEARSWYSFERDVDVHQIGFIMRDDGLMGGSPDGSVGEDGLTEIKCLSAVNHVRALLSDANEHVGQCQFLLMLTKRAWVDLIFYNPVLPPIVRRIERDRDYIATLISVLDIFVAELEADKSKLWQHRRGGPATDYAPMSDEETAALVTRLPVELSPIVLSAMIAGRWAEVRRIAQGAQEYMLASSFTPRHPGRDHGEDRAEGEGTP